MFKKSILTVLVALLLVSMSADKKAYQLYNSKGKDVNYSKMIDQIKDADIVFFGESHNNAIGHWLELEIAKSLFAERGSQFIIGAEMYESDQQLIVDEYISGIVAYKYFKEQARLWKNDATDYNPILDFALENKIPFIATNVPRRYAAIVNNGGLEALDSLSDEAKALIAPLPILYDDSLACYKNMLAMMGDHASPKMVNITRAQALKDATMAHFILKNWEPGKCFFHFNGSYHSESYESIIWYLKQANPNLKIATITTIEQENIDKVEDSDLTKADFILVVDEDVTKTY